MDHIIILLYVYCRTRILCILRSRTSNAYTWTGYRRERRVRRVHYYHYCIIFRIIINIRGKGHRIQHNLIYNVYHYRYIVLHSDALPRAYINLGQHCVTYVRTVYNNNNNNSAPLMKYIIIIIFFRCSRGWRRGSALVTS